MFPNDGPSYQVLAECEVSGTDLARESYCGDLINFLAPADTRQIEAWLAELSVLVARRPAGEFDEAVKLEAYASRLRRFPADVVRHVLIEKTWKFWPTWDELQAACSRLAGTRRAILAALDRPAKEEKPIQPPSPEQRKRLSEEAEAMLVEMRAKLTEDRKPKERIPHWSETAPPDDPRWEQLRRARDANPIIRASRGLA